MMVQSDQTFLAPLLNCGTLLKSPFRGLGPLPGNHCQSLIFYLSVCKRFKHFWSVNLCEVLFSDVFDLKIHRVATFLPVAAAVMLKHGASGKKPVTSGTGQ